MTSAQRPNDQVVQNRRAQLRRWIDEHHGGSQTAFIASTFDGSTQVNQGELSGLLKTKSFGEKRARRLEQQAGMPTGYLDLPAAATVERGRKLSSTEVREPEPIYITGKERPITWPFQLVTYGRLMDLKKSLGTRAAHDAIRDIDKYLDALVTRWEKEAAAGIKRRAGSP